jgi:CRP/FNR family transcriptional regulator, dissimilatory nitrate respiration regulator
MNSLPLSSMQIREAMSRLAYFHGWDTEQLNRLASSARLLDLPRNTGLVRKGESLNTLYVVISGQIRLYLPLPDEAERVISMIAQGESFGEACLILDEASPFDAVTTRNSHVLAINAQAYRRELRLESAHMERTLKLVSKRMLNMLRDMEICSQRSSLQRVACFLLQYKPLVDTGPFEIQLPGRKRDIAAKLGLSQETFSRVLSFLAQQSIIRVKGGHILVENGEKLSMLSPTGCPKEAEAA